MEGLPFWIGIVTGLAAVAQIIATIQRRIRAVHAQDEQRRRQVTDASKAVREKALFTLKLKREEKAMLSEIRTLTDGIDKGEAHVARVRRSEEFFYVMDERKNPGDHPFLAEVSHPDFGQVSRGAPADVTGSWSEGRRYLIWASTEKMARAKATLRLAPEKGFVVGTVELFKDGADEL